MSLDIGLLPPEISLAPASHAENRVDSESALLEQLAFQHGQVYDSYLACEPERQHFWSADRSGVITYVRIGGHLKVGGGLLAAQIDRPQLLDEFLEFVSQNHKSAVFFNITDTDLPLFQERGIQVTKWGEDAIIYLTRWTCQGKAYEWLRRQRNYCTRHKVRCVEWHPHQCSPDEWQATREVLVSINADSLQFKPQSREMRFFQGHLDFNNLGRKRIFLARSEDGQGRIEAFVVANPYQSGTAWSYEIFRHRQDALRGVVPHLELAVIDLLKAEGVEQVSLCLIPGLNCQPVRSGDSGLVRRCLNWTARHLNFIYDCAGLYHHKSRFRPQLESRYVCAYPRVSAMTFLTTVHLTGLLRVCPVKVVKLMWCHMMNKSRSTLPKVSGPHAK